MKRIKRIKQLLMLLLLLLLDGGFATAQTVSATLVSYIYQGSTTNLNFTFTDSTPSASVAGMQWGINMPPGFTLGTPVAGPVTIAAGKTITCSGTTCIVTGTNSTVINSGLIATIPVTVSTAATPGLWAVGLPSLLGTNVFGTALNPPLNFSTGTGAGSINTTLPVTVSSSTGTTTWFIYTSGNNTLTVKKVYQVPMKVSWVSINPYGQEDGSYTADPNNGSQQGNIVTIHTGSTDSSNASLTCYIALNSTATILNMGNFGFVPPASAAYSCSGSGNGSVSWP